ncbi:uncharacterized protein LOC124824555 [Vigna umbellata]|uniref:uncharacterized protein LOC124824555 n=1 Tax=Vigna umbellata TaxID=87088 RepID=UPI001F5FE62F|nr:uncharacterized protein LOC124824555 [Vigna umbellata]
MRQGREETLKVFMDRFNQIARHVRNVDQKLIIGALTIALRPGPFVDFLYTEEPQTLAEFQNRATRFIRIEEGRAFQQAPLPLARSNRGRKDGGRMLGRNDGASDQRHRDLPRVPQYVHYMPLNAPRARVMEEALIADLLTLTQSPTPKGADGRKHCQYHQNFGYTTEDCTTLKDKLENLIQEGHLRRYVQDKGRSPLGGARRPPKRSNHPQRDDRRSRSRSRKRPLQGIINTISGGFAGRGPSASVRKR